MGGSDHGYILWLNFLDEAGIIRCFIPSYTVLGPVCGTSCRRSG